ncbi:MAG: hypothetical protein J6B75_04725 [Ruminococcus sp.]|nr:hypothetical protein [Ruminococcus sp.]
MKIAFKVFSVLLIIWAAVVMIAGTLLIFATDKLFELAGDAGIAVGSLGAAGMLVSVIGVIVVAVAALMLYTGINGLRGRMDKCKKFTLVFLIISAVNFVLSLAQDSNTASAFLQVLFFGVYFFLAKMYMKYDDTY